MKINKEAAIKSTVETIVSVGVGAVVGHVIKSNVPSSLKLFPRITVGVGTFALSNVLGDLAAKYTTGQIDEMMTQIRAAQRGFPPIPND